MDALSCFCELLGKRPTLADLGGWLAISCRQTLGTVWPELGPLSTEPLAHLDGFLGIGWGFQCGLDETGQQAQGGKAGKQDQGPKEATNIQDFENLLQLRPICAMGTTN